MVGGTGLYLKATLYDYRFREEDNSTCYDDLSTEELLKRIGKYNYVPKDKNNRRRLIRELKKLENNIDIDNNTHMCINTVICKIVMIFNWNLT